MNVYEQDPPFSLHLEPVEGCSLACSFCALQSIRDSGADFATGKHGTNSAPYLFADVSLFDEIGRQVNHAEWNPRVEIDGRGEPTAHPQLAEIIGALRKWLPKQCITLTTNGSGLLKAGNIDKLFKAGLDTLAFDHYRHAKWGDQVLDMLVDYAADNAIPFYRYPEQKEGNPHQRHFGMRIVRIEDISLNTTGTHKITNQAGNSGPKESLEQRCAKPFRELNIRYDGNVAVCCDDWRGVYKIGNVLKQGVEAIWLHPAMDAARRYLWRGQRDQLQPCDGCNVRTFRNGLLPDKYGQDSMPPVNNESRGWARKAQAGKVFSIKLSRGDK